jgi:hypothetical protein
MRRKRVWRYYCDFCKKSGCSAGHMRAHEAACTANPERACGMCRREGASTLVRPLIDALGAGDTSGVERLRAAAEGCPACMLAAIRQSGLQTPFEVDGPPGFHVEFDYQEEKREWWAQQNPDDYADAHGPF